MIIYHGLMGSGKSEKLINIVKELQQVKFFNFEVYSPLSNVVESRNGEVIECTRLNKFTFPVIKSDLDFILVDEAQFLTAAQFRWLKNWCTEKEVILVLFGLLRDYQNCNFEYVDYLQGFKFIEVPSTCNECLVEKAFISAKYVPHVSFNGIKTKDEIEKNNYTKLCKTCYKDLKIFNKVY